MKFVLVLAGVSLLAGAAAFVATSPASASGNELAGDWRCNDTINGITSVTLLSVADDGATRGQFLMNTEFEGRWVVVNLVYTGRVRVEGSELVETADNLRITNGSVDGKSMPASIKTALLEQVAPGSARYHIDELSASKLTYSDEQGRSICERSPVPLKL